MRFMYSRKLAGSGISRNLFSQSRSVWLDRGAYPTKEGSSAARVKGDAVRTQISSKAANRRMQSLSKWNVGDYSGIVEYDGDSRSQLCRRAELETLPLPTTTMAGLQTGCSPRSWWSSRLANRSTASPLLQPLLPEWGCRPVFLHSRSIRREQRSVRAAQSLRFRAPAVLLDIPARFA